MENKVRAAADDLLSEDRELVGRGMLVLRELGGQAAAELLEIAHGWDDQHKMRWLGYYAGGSPTDFLANAISDPRAMDALIEAFHDPDPRFRGFAVLALGRIDDPRVPDLLVEAFSDDDFKVRINSVLGLMSLGEKRSVEIALAAMRDDNERVRSMGARALRWIGGPEYADVLLEALSDPSEKVIASAAGSLGRLLIESAVEPLIALLHSGSRNVAWSVIHALGDIGGPAAVEALMKALQTNEDLRLRRSAAGDLVKLAPDRTLEVMIVMLKESDPQLRRLAAEILNELSDSRAADALAEALEDRDDDVSRKAALALANIGDKRAIDRLIEMLNLEPRMEKVRVGVNPDRFVDEDMNRRHRDSAASALAKLGDARGDQYLARMLHSDDSRQVGNVFTIPGASHYPRSLKPLVEMLNAVGIGRWRRSGVLMAIARIGTQEAIDVVKSVMASGGEGAVDAAGELATLGLDEGFEYLQSEIESGDSERRIRARAELSYNPHPKSIALLLASLQDDSLMSRILTIDSLGRMAGREAIKDLERFLDDENRRIRVAAYLAMKQIERRALGNG